MHGLEEATSIHVTSGIATIKQVVVHLELLVALPLGKQHDRLTLPTELLALEDLPESDFSCQGAFLPCGALVFFVVQYWIHFGTKIVASGRATSLLQLSQV